MRASARDENVIITPYKKLTIEEALGWIQDDELLEADRIALWTDKINLKHPREGSGFRWHQDSPCWSHVCGYCDRLANVMITLAAADRDNGCFRVIPGSQMSGTRNFARAIPTTD